MNVDVPLRRCHDCKHDLGDVMLAVGKCPLFGQRRTDVEIRCAAFVPKRAKEVRSKRREG